MTRQILIGAVALCCFGCSHEWDNTWLSDGATSNTTDAARDGSLLDRGTTPPPDVKAPDDVGAADAMPADTLAPDALAPDTLAPDTLAPDTLPAPESNCLDGIDNNGDGKIDCEDPSCDAKVMCVPATGGNDVGLLQSAACSGAYPSKTVLHQGLNAGSCSGCGCSTQTTCKLDVYRDTSTTNCASKVFVGTVKYGECIDFADTTASSLYFTMEQHHATTCTESGSPTFPAASWSSTRNFCATSQTSSTCPNGGVCVARPSVGGVCVRVPVAGATCPTGFTGSKATWYGNMNDGRACAPCACTVTGNGSCAVVSSLATEVIPYRDNCSTRTCMYSSPCDSYYLGWIPADQDHCRGYANNWPQTATIGALVYSQQSTSAGTCTASAPTTGSATPTQPSTICCQ